MNDSSFSALDAVGPPRGNPPRRPSQAWKYVLTAVVTMLVTFALTAGAGLMVLGIMNTGSDGLFNQDRLSLSFAQDEATAQALAKLQEVYQQVKQNYYLEQSDAELLEAMTRGMVNELGNRYTMYLTAEQNQQISESMSGNYSGIGAFVGLNKDGLVEITEIIEDSPAEAAGLMVGDLFVAVDGQDVTGFNDITAVAVLVRGVEGTSVELVLYRPALGENVAVTTVRRKITTASVSHKMLDDTIGYIHVRDFSQNVAKNFIAALKDLQDKGAIHLVIDLRNNTGGLATEVIAMLDYLLPAVTLATLAGRNNGRIFEESWRSDKAMGVPETMRYAILINGISASASELFAGCLRDLGKAVLVGEQSFGKGSGTITIDLDDGSAINLTNFLYYLPGGDSIEEVGLVPDLAVTLPEEARGQSLNRLPLELDTQLGAAIKALR
jgi:carboxyl-terminal processing protease